jgi:hypothetical protein
MLVIDVSYCTHTHDVVSDCPMHTDTMKRFTDHVAADAYKDKLRADLAEKGEWTIRTIQS